MPFKLVTIVENSLSLGSILLTSGVHVISIDTINNKDMKAEPVQDPLKFLPKHMSEHISKNINKTRFSHPLGKAASDFIIEYLEQHKAAGWSDLRDIVEKQGFSKTTVNNGIARLLKLKRIMRVATGRYSIIPKKISE